MELTLRDALRDAMAEEMLRDKSVFLMGEDVSQYEGAYKVTRNLLKEFGPKRATGRNEVMAERSPSDATGRNEVMAERSPSNATAYNEVMAEREGFEPSMHFSA